MLGLLLSVAIGWRGLSSCSGRREKH